MESSRAPVNRENREHMKKDTFEKIQGAQKFQHSHDIQRKEDFRKKSAAHSLSYNKTFVLILQDTRSHITRQS